MKNYTILALLFLFVSCGNRGSEFVLNVDNADGLTTEVKITLNGFEIGEVKDMKITSDGTIDVLCEIDSETKLPSDSRFKIETIDILGSKGIVVDLGESPRELKNGESIKLIKIEKNIEESIGNKVGEFIESFNDNQKQDSILIELRRLNENLEKREK